MVNVKFKNLKTAAKKVARSIQKHMRTDGWDLDYGFQVEEVFYQAFGHHLEDYLFEELCKFKKPLVLKMKGNRVVLSKKKTKKDLVLRKKLRRKK